MYSKSGLSHRRIKECLDANVHHRRSFSLAERVHFLSLVDTMKAQGKSFNTICTELNISKASLERWRKDLPDTTPQDLSGLDSISTRTIMRSITSSDSLTKSKKHHDGPSGFLSDIAEELIRYVMEWRDRGMPVTRFALAQKAAQLKPEFGERSYQARMMVISRFIFNNDLVHCCATHTAQRLPESVKSDALSFMDIVCPKCAEGCRSPDYIINMDQTNVYFKQSPKRTIDMKGARTVHMRMGADDSKRCTVAFTVTSSGRKIAPMIVYPAVPGGVIERRELPTHPTGMHYTVQKKGWFDKHVMLEWVNNVLAPYVVTAPPDVIPLLLLDSFKVHLKGTITNAIQALGVEIKFIPAGCTGLVQPINVGFNEPFKTYMTHLYSDFMMAQDPDMPFCGATRREVSAWVK
jgi:hypothetical protein